MRPAPPDVTQSPSGVTPPGQSPLGSLGWRRLIPLYLGGSAIALWLLLTVQWEKSPLYLDYGAMALAMLGGSFIAGSTMLGGGVVAFPVSTLVFGISPEAGRDFALLIQSVGMSAASVAILAYRVPIAMALGCWAALGGALGVVVGIEYIAPQLPASQVKMFFAALITSFGGVLVWCFRGDARLDPDAIGGLTARDRGLLLLLGFVGGLCSGITGTGLDFIAFSAFVLIYRLNETVATPTSVILMASNAVVGAIWQGSVGGGFQAISLDLWWVAIPVVVVGAPLGALVGRRWSRLQAVTLLLLLIIAQFIVTLWVVPQNGVLLLFTVAVLLGGGVIFAVMRQLGLGRTVSGGRALPRSV